MDKMLVRWDSNWADEMDIEGFSIMSKEEWDELKKFLKKKTNSFCIYVGSNEEIDYDCGESLLAELKAKKITPEEEKVVKKFLGSNFGFVEFLNEIEHDEDELDYDDDDGEDN